MDRYPAILKQNPTHSDIFVTEDGDVFRLLTPSRDSGGYHQIRNGRIRSRRHTLVCEAFHGQRPAGHAVRHLDGNPANDAPTNLTWGTQTENMQDAVRHGTHHTGAKINSEQRAEILARSRAGERGKDLAEEFGISPQRVSDIKAGR